MLLKPKYFIKKFYFVKKNYKNLIKFKKGSKNRQYSKKSHTFVRDFKIKLIIFYS